MLPLTASERAALAELRSWLDQRFGRRLLRVALFGSRARGEGDEDSDLDVLVVVEELASQEAREVAWMAGDLLTQHDVLVSPFAVSRAYFENLERTERRIAAEINRDAVPL